jgi:cephalosporin hydroxylase
MSPAIANDPTLINAMQNDGEIKILRKKLLQAIVKYKYTYNFTWFGRPIIQLPEDIIAIQEIILNTKPDIIIETGVAHGGGLILYASLLELLGKGTVIGVDIEIRKHNREALEKHPLFKRITLIEGSSTENTIFNKVTELCSSSKNVMVILDSDHTHAHVLRELELYSMLVKKNGYLIVFDTGIEDVDDKGYPDRPWGKGNNPKTAVWEFLKKNDRFVIDKEIENKLLITVAPDGYLKCVKD